MCKYFKAQNLHHLLKRHLIYMNVLAAYMYVQQMNAWCLGSQNNTGPLKLEFQMVVSIHAGA